MLGLTPDEYRSLLLSVGTRRRERPLMPVEVAQLFERAISAGYSLQECAEAAHFKGSSMVSRFLSLLRLAPEIRHLVDWGQSGSTIPFSAAFELSRLVEGDHQSVAQAVLQHRLGSAEVRQLVQLRKRSGRPISDCIEDILRMRPQVERKHVFIGAVTSEHVRSELNEIGQQRRDELLRSVVAEQFTDSSAVAVRLGTERFTLVGDDRFAEQLADDGRDFEQIVNEELVRRIEH